MVRVVRIRPVRVRVHERVRLLGLVRHAPQRIGPLGELLLGVEVVESVRGRAPAHVPRLRIAAVEADVRRRCRERDDGGNEVLRLRPRRVDDHVPEPVRLEERERPGAVLLLEPAPVAELDLGVVAVELLAHPLEVLERPRLHHDVRGHLEQDRPELAGLAQRLDHLAEQLEDDRARVPGHALDAAALVGGERGGERLGEDVVLHAVARHRREGLHVEDESLGHRVCPFRHRLRRLQAVEGRVDLDGVEDRGVVGEALRPGSHPRRVEDLGQRLVGERARADADRRHGSTAAFSRSSGGSAKSAGSWSSPIRWLTSRSHGYAPEARKASAARTWRGAWWKAPRRVSSS